MVGMRSDRASARARDLLATVYPVPDDAEFRRLRELAIDYIREAERLEAANKGLSAKHRSFAGTFPCLPGSHPPPVLSPTLEGRTFDS